MILAHWLRQQKWIVVGSCFAARIFHTRFHRAKFPQNYPLTSLAFVGARNMSSRHMPCLETYVESSTPIVRVVAMAMSSSSISRESESVSIFSGPSVNDWKSKSINRRSSSRALQLAFLRGPTISTADEGRVTFDSCLGCTNKKVIAHNMFYKLFFSWLIFCLSSANPSCLCYKTQRFNAHCLL
jgi:hypothetical protein